MKHISTLVLAMAICCLSATVSAQNLFGLKSGITLSDQTNTIVDGSLRFDVTFGLSYEWQTSLGNLWIQPEINYISKGVTLGVVGNTTQYKRKIQYMEAPILLKYKYVYSNQFDWALVAGPSVGVALKAENRFFRIARPTIEELPLDKSTGVNPIDFGMILGAEANFAVDYGQITLYGRLQYGISRVAADPEGLPIRNRLFEGGMVFKFGRARDMTFTVPVEDEPDPKEERRASSKKKSKGKKAGKRKMKKRG